MTLPDKRYYRPDEIARELDEPLCNVYRWIREGLIGHIHVGRKIKITRAEAVRIIQQGVQRSATPVQ